MTNKRKAQLVRDILQTISGQDTQVGLDALVTVLIFITRAAKISDADACEVLKRSYRDAPPTPEGIVTMVPH